MLWFFESFFPVVWIAFILYWRTHRVSPITYPRIAVRSSARAFRLGTEPVPVGTHE